MSNYWKSREQEQKYKYQTKTEKEIARKMAALYRAAAKDIERDMTDVYLTILAEGGDTLINNLYRYNRYFTMRDKINKRLNTLGADSLKEISRGMMDMYKWTAATVLSSSGFEVNSKKDLDRVLKTLWEANGKNWSSKVWCADGKDAATRLVSNMTKLQSTLEKGMVDCVVRGVSKDELVKTLQKRFDVSFSEADRVARTELTYIQNQATMDSYKKAGIEEYEYMAEVDERTSEECEELDGQRFPITAAIVGVNYPPLHANCRCTTIAVIE